MSKSPDPKKDNKKRPQKTAQAKKQAKREKKNKYLLLSFFRPFFSISLRASTTDRYAAVALLAAQKGFRARQG